MSELQKALDVLLGKIDNKEEDMFTKRELEMIEEVFAYVIDISGLSDGEEELLEKVKQKINEKPCNFS